jgi:cytochrome c-type biogenesis protein CcmH/NrfG
LKKVGEFIAMLIRRWVSKTPKSARITQIVVGVLGSAAVIILSIPSLGLPLWASVGVGIVAATSMAYEQVKDDSDETVVRETKKIFEGKRK